MAISKNKRKKVHEKFDGHCAYCGEELEYEDMHIDHIVPKNTFKVRILNKFRIPVFLLHLTEHDMDHIDNLFPACRMDNRFKSSFDLELFKLELQYQLGRAKKYSTNYRFALKYNQVVETPYPIIFYFEMHKQYCAEGYIPIDE